MGANYVWASLARYDDDLVAALEDWERHTRDEHGALGVRRPGSDHPAAEREGDRLDDVFEDGRWDLHKMVRCFARLGEIGEATRTVSQGIDKHEKILTYTLQALNHTRWQGIKQDIRAGWQGQPEQVRTEAYDLSPDENRSVSDSESRPMIPGTAANFTSKLPFTNSEQGVILDAEREVRIKLHMGQVFMGWIWLIPTFHIPQPSLMRNGGGMTPTRTTLRLKRKEVDFPVGLGAGIVDVEISLEWVMPDGSQEHEESTTTFKLSKKEGESIKPPASDN